MLIVLEIGLNVAGKRGIDLYMGNMIEALGEVDRKNQYVLFTYFFRDFKKKLDLLPRPPAENFELFVPRAPESVTNALEYKAKIPVVDRALLGGRRPDVYHVLGGGHLPQVRAKTVVTFFDLAVEAFPKTGTPDPGKMINDPFTHEYAHRADKLIATGEYTKNDLKRYYGIADEKISVLTTGVNFRLFHPIKGAATLDRVRARYNLPPRFLMIIGPFEPARRTNAPTVLEAYAAAVKEGLAKDCKLVFVGKRNAAVDSLFNLGERLGIADRLSATGYVDLEDLAAIYSLTEAVLLPTSIEGFGFGNEVMACGAPFITSNLPGVLEAVGDAALTVPPADVPALTRALRDFFAKPGLREELIRKGTARAAKYDYRRIAERLVGVYEELVAL
jgi:glycosyltransferase involved in cell wall biosynthesis